MARADNGQSFIFKTVFESLEDRVLFDGVPDATFVLPQADAQEPVPAQVQEVQQAEISSTRELILIDAGVENSDQLLAGILESKPDTILEIRIIENNQDGVSQITQLLAEAEGQYDAIHIVSHGSAGEVNLGNSTLTVENLNNYSDLLATWAGALTEDADLLFYGCDLAGNAQGESFIEAISEITGADVAASDDLTGAADKGGDWDLELNVGTVETAALSATAFDGVLADTDGDSVDDADDQDDDNDGILDTDEGYNAAGTTSLTSSALNSPGFPVNTELQESGTPVPGTTTGEETGDGTTATLDGLFGGVLDFEATLIEDGQNNTIIWDDGVQIRPHATVGDHIFVQPRDTADFNIDSDNSNGSFELNDSAQFTFTFNSPVENFSFITGGINDGDTAFYTASYQGVAVPITAANFSNLDTGVTIVNGNGLNNLLTAGGTSVTSNRGTLTIDGPIDRLVINTGKSNQSNSTNTLGFTTFSGDVITTPASFIDTDGDGIADHQDLDSDNDGISDLIESGADPSVDVDRDGVYDNSTGAGAQVGSNGVPTAASGGVTPVDSDNDGVDDYLDLDSDNDGIPDTIEAFPTVDFQANDGDVTNDDSDGDGVLDAFDMTTGHGGDFSVPEDTDTDGTADFLDLDSDGDRIDDSTESGLTPGADNDGDGIADNIAPDSYEDPDGIINDPLGNSTGLENATDNNPTDADFRSLNDKDGDGVADIVDLDDDNDGILDVDEAKAGLIFDSNGVIITSRTFDVTGTTVINPTYTDSFITGDNLYTNYDQGTFGTAVVPPDDGDPSTSETVSPADNPYLGNVVDQNGNSLDGSYDDYANLGFGEYSIVANIDEEGARNSSQAFPVIDPVYGRQGRFFTADPNASAVPTLSDTISNLVPGQLYEYSFWAANSETNGAPNSIGVQIGQPGGILEEVLNTGGLPSGSSGIPTDGPSSNGVVWTRFSFVFQADASGQLKVDLASTGNDPAGNDFLIDNIELRSASVDTDGDGVHDGCDLDSDNDGVSDLVESGADASVDMDGDGVYDNTTGAGALVDANGVPTAASGGVAPVDSDGDGIADFVDLDSDNDGIPDAVEAQPTSGYQSPAIGSDSDGDGVVDTFDTGSGHGGDFAAPQDTDGDGTADYLDIDSDNDGQSDTAESGLTPGADNNGDGIADNVAPNSYDDTDGVITDPAKDLDNESGDNSEVGYRESSLELGVAKEIFAGPTIQPDGSYTLTYQVVVENNGSADIEDLSLIDDLEEQFGAAFVSASNLRLITGPTDSGSSVSVNSAYDGDMVTQMINPAGSGSNLVIGDSFTVRFDVVVNPTNSALDNQVKVSGIGIGSDGNPILDSKGNSVVVTDDSDSGADPDDPNIGQPGDTGGSDDATPLYLPAIGLAKQAGDAVANGDNFDVEFTLNWENTGNVALDSVQILDDLRGQFGSQFVGVAIDSVMTSGTATVAANGAWGTANTSQSLITHTGDDLAAGDTIQVVFTVTINPDAGGTSSTGLENQATSSGTGVNPDTNAPDLTLRATDTSDNGTDPASENGEDNGDGTFANDPTPIILADISVVKEVVSTTPVGDNFEVVYQLVVENTGNVDLADVSLIDNLELQFGDAFVSAGNLTWDTLPPVGSSIRLDAGWDGDGTAEMIDQTVTTNLLKAGDWFVVQITVTVDPDATGTSGPLNNQATAQGDAVDDMGNAILDSANTSICHDRPQ